MSPANNRKAESDKMAQLTNDGAFFIFLGVPEGTEFGIDYISWNVGQRFCGVKMIPPGIHFIYYSACDRFHQSSPRSGFFYEFKPREVVVMKYDRNNEDIQEEPVSEEETQRCRDNLPELDRHLGPYPVDSYRTWVALTSHLTGANMRRLQPINGRITSVPQLLSEASDSQSRSKVTADGESGKAPSSESRVVVEGKPGAGAERVEENVDVKIQDQKMATSIYENTSRRLESKGCENDLVDLKVNTEVDVNADERVESGDDRRDTVTMVTVNERRGNDICQKDSEAGSMDTSDDVSNDVSNAIQQQFPVSSDVSTLAADKRPTASIQSCRTPDPYDSLPDMPVIPGTEIRFTPIPNTKYPPCSSPSEITKYSMDSSYVLDRVLNEMRLAQIPDPETALLGEIQFAFVCFLIGQVYDAFDRWKRLVAILCRSEEAMSAYPRMFTDFISVVHFEIREVPRDFFVDIVTRDNFLTATLRELFVNSESSPCESLRSRARKFKQHVTEKFQWDFSDEPSEYAPVVVPT